MLYVVTFIFDALLAYEISKKIYDVWAMNQIMDQPPYTMEMAFSSPEFWIIIFAGFIAYVIWGLVFDFTMDNYAEMTSNVKTIARIKNEIERIVQKLNNLHAQHAQITNAIVKIDGKIETLRNELEHNVTYNTDQIIQEVNNFFNGWIAYMTLVVKPEDEKENARSVKELAISIFK